MADYKINGQRVSKADWDTLRDCFHDETVPVFWERLFPSAPFDDNTLTAEEIKTLLDTNKDDRIYFDDLGKWSIAQFNSIRDVLGRHGFAQFDFIKDRTAVLAEIRQNPFSLKYAYPSFQNDREIILEAVRQYGRTLQFASAELQKDPEIALTAVRQNSQALQYVSPDLKENPEFLLDAARLNIHVIEQLRRHNYKYYEALFATIWKEFLTPSPDILPPPYYKWKEEIIEKYDIEFLERFRSPGVLRATLDARNHPEIPATKPVAVFIAPKTDWNRGFSEFPTIDRLYELGYFVLYYENNDDEEINHVLLDATQNGRRKADLILLAGHGTAADMEIGAPYDTPYALIEEWIRGESLYLDTGDFVGDPPQIDLGNFLKPSGSVVLYACQTGEGLENNPDNMANTIAKQLPPTATIHAPNSPTNIKSINIENGKLSVEWLRGTKPYQISGKK